MNAADIHWGSKKNPRSAALIYMFFAFKGSGDALPLSRFFSLPPSEFGKEGRGKDYLNRGERRGKWKKERENLTEKWRLSSKFVLFFCLGGKNNSGRHNGPLPRSRQRPCHILGETGMCCVRTTRSTQFIGFRSKFTLPPPPERRAGNINRKFFLLKKKFFGSRSVDYRIRIRNAAFL